MSTDRQAQARAEAERRWKKGDDRASDFQHKVGCIKGFTQGVEWADANPKPTTITQSEAEVLILAIADKIPPGTRRAEEFANAILLTLHAAGIEVVDDEPDIPETCAECGKPAKGFAMINDMRYCHPDEGPSCYMGGRQ